MEDEVESHQRAAVVEHPMDEPLFLDHVLSDEEIDLAVLSEAEAAEMNYFTGSSIAFTQPAISKRYDCPTHFSSLNLDAMNEHFSHRQCAPYNDPTIEFELGQEFQNKEAILMAVKTYSINRLVGQDHGRLDSKVIAQYIFAMVKIDPTIAIRVLQGSVEKHFGYKASYRKV
ncbi:hypothetical protein PIB30_065678 [Stylosanthes scabra]|uniref:Uncharacterized protein n=1 Tax=Stylosanthes scabra TaxID=79078 RepID=A0ABU6ZKS3_9FABA|nr:hypothetical protein [Stylosanthes scabra]